MSTSCLSYLEKQIDVFKLKCNLKVGNKPEVTFEIHSQKPQTIPHLIPSVKSSSPKGGGGRGGGLLNINSYVYICKVNFL